MNKINLMQGDCLERMSKIPDNSIDAIVTDPPYGLSFMGKKWDYDVPSVEIWAECLRVLKPGGHLLAFAGTRTQHRMAVRIEDAGFEIRDMIAWVYGSGFPKSLDVSKALDKMAGAEREVIGTYTARGFSDTSPTEDGRNQWAAGEVSDKLATRTAPATDAARQWQGWGTALKPALEPITVARKPLIGAVAQNIIEHGTGAINIDGCRVATDDKLGGGNNSATVDRNQMHEGWKRPWMHDAEAAARAAERSRESTARSEALGRWPANLIHDGSEDVVEQFPYAESHGGGKSSFGGMFGNGKEAAKTFASKGSAARFFYCAKASKSDRGDGNVHPTVKPTDLMRYLCRLVTPPSGTVLDPFMGSGSTGKAAMLEGFQFVGIERDPDYFKIAEARINNAKAEKLLI